MKPIMTAVHVRTAAATRHPSRWSIGPRRSARPLPSNRSHNWRRWRRWSTTALRGFMDTICVNGPSPWTRVRCNLCSVSGWHDALAELAPRGVEHRPSSLNRCQSLISSIAEEFSTMSIWKVTSALALVAALMIGQRMLRANEAAQAAACCCGTSCACEVCTCCDGGSCSDCDCDACDCATCDCGACDCDVCDCAACDCANGCDGCECCTTSCGEGGSCSVGSCVADDCCNSGCCSA